MKLFLIDIPIFGGFNFMPIPVIPTPRCVRVWFHYPGWQIPFHAHLTTYLLSLPLNHLRLNYAPRAAAPPDLGVEELGCRRGGGR